MKALTVSQLNRYVKSILQGDDNLQDLYLRAEISNFKNHYQSGHWYFTLKDKKASVRGVMFRSYAQNTSFVPEEGMELLVRCSVNLYEVDGSYQVYVTDMQPYGVGAMEIAIRQLREKLEKEGLFAPEHKKPLPQYPSSIGVITSKTGAAIGDIEHVLSRRYPLAKVKFCPALVQGKEAPTSLIQSLNTLDGTCDVIILGRGGGSKEDLWAFQDEDLARAIFNAQTPIISAVGHEMDVSICDMVADERAPTPSAAAELATPSIDILKRNLMQYQHQVFHLSQKEIQKQQVKLTYLNQSPALQTPRFLLDKKENELDFLLYQLDHIKSRYFEAQETTLLEKKKLLESLNPLSVLRRGYSAVFKNGKPVQSVAQIEENDMLLLQFSDGSVEVKVSRIGEKGKQ